MAVLNELLEANQRFAEGFEKGDLAMPPARQVAVLTCMDARLHPERFLGLHIGEGGLERDGTRSTQRLRSRRATEFLYPTAVRLWCHVRLRFLVGPGRGYVGEGVKVPACGSEGEIRCRRVAGRDRSYGGGAAPRPFPD
ncbi:MAG: hypothetical protein ACRDG9_09210 [Actinomycetota bacterium]